MTSRARGGRAIGLGALLLAGLGSQVGAPRHPGLERPASLDTRDTVTIRAWTHAAPTSIEFQVLQAAAAAFSGTQRAHRVEILPSISESYDERVRAAAITGTLPCLLEVDGPFVSVFAWPGYLLPLDRFMTEDLRQDLLPSILAQGTYDHHLWTLGQFNSGLGLWGRRHMLEEAGIRIATMESPWSLAEFEEALARLSARPGLEYALSLNLYAGTEFYSYAFAPIIQGFGGDLIERRQYRSAKGVLDGPEAVAAMGHFQRWFQAGWTRPILDRVDDFERGRVALSWTGHWKYHDFRGAIGDDLVLMPLPDFGRGVKTGMGSWSWGISSSCRSPAAAWTFLAFLLSRDEILRMTSANGAIPARKSVLGDSPLYAPGGPLSVFTAQLDAGYGVPRPETPAYGAINRAFARAVRAIVAGGDVQRSLTEAARRIDADIVLHRGYPRQ